jgi:probable phosphomutase (TIGR03848 family)
VSTVLLIRHGLTGVTGSRLAGWTPGVGLDDRGRAQGRELADRLGAVPLAALVSSPLERCRETAELLAADRGIEIQLDERVGECHYGEWTGAELKRLARDPLWRVVQAHPSAAQFPGPDGESLRATAARAVDALRDWNERLGADATYAVVSHADVIKALLADALGLHLDFFQRLVVDPCSVSVVRYTPLRPFVLRVNEIGGFADLVPKRRRGRRRMTSSDAVVGGGAGS